MSKVDTYFLITVNEDGTLTSFTTIPEELPEVNRVANTFDVFQAAKQITEEFQNQLLADRVAQTVIAALSPQVESPVDKIKDKLKERGIDPESVTPTE